MSNNRENETRSIRVVLKALKQRFSASFKFFTLDLIAILLLFSIGAPGVDGRMSDLETFKFQKSSIKVASVHSGPATSSEQLPLDGDEDGSDSSDPSDDFSKQELEGTLRPKVIHFFSFVSPYSQLAPLRLESAHPSEFNRPPRHA